ncbi:signal peptidase II [Lagierella sp.]|uniref:signal peptidase II n=1 Tax=Lagierella sp. TaxID=2849657 RepID=UPI00260739CE|nr:signal peptidase II [Lagierella sp.]
MGLLIIILAILIDQITKYLAIGLKKGSIGIIDSYLNLIYVENRGAAFGILQGKKFFLTFVTLGVILAMSFYLYKGYNKFSLISKIGLSLIIGGAIGNLIDRVFRHYVIDFISVTFPNGYDFPVFNVADICVVIGTIFIILAFFTTKDFEGVL